MPTWRKKPEKCTFVSVCTCLAKSTPWRVKIDDMYMAWHTCCAHLGSYCSYLRRCTHVCTRSPKMCHTCHMSHACSWSAITAAPSKRVLPLVLVCHCMPQGTILAGATVPAKCAPYVHSPLHATAVPHVPAMPRGRKSPPTLSSLIFFSSQAFFTPNLAQSFRISLFPKLF